MGMRKLWGSELERGSYYKRVVVKLKAGRAS